MKLCIPITQINLLPVEVDLPPYVRTDDNPYVSLTTGEGVSLPDGTQVEFKVLRNGSNVESLSYTAQEFNAGGSWFGYNQFEVV